MTGQSERAKCIDAFLPRTTPSVVDTEIENRQNYSMSIMVVLFSSIISLHCIALQKYGRNGEAVFIVVAFCLLVLARMRLLCNCAARMIGQEDMTCFCMIYLDCNN